MGVLIPDTVGEGLWGSVPVWRFMFVYIYTISYCSHVLHLVPTSSPTAAPRPRAPLCLQCPLYRPRQYRYACSHPRGCREPGSDSSLFPLSAPPHMSQTCPRCPQPSLFPLNPPGVVVIHTHARAHASVRTHADIKGSLRTGPIRIGTVQCGRQFTYATSQSELLRSQGPVQRVGQP